MKSLSMPQIFRLAVRNLGRVKRRLVITAAVIALGVGLFIWIDGFVLGTSRQSETNLITYETGAFRIVSKQWWKERDFMPLNYSFQGYEEFMTRLKNLGWHTTPVVEFFADVIVTDGNLILPIMAVDFTSLDSVLPLTKHLVAGSVPKPNHAQAILGSWLAKDLGLEVGSEFVLQTRTREGSYQTLDLVVSGLVTTPHPAINRGRILMDLNLAKEVLQLDHAVTSVVAAVSNPYAIEQEAKRALAALDLSPNLNLLSWKELGADAVASAQQDQQQTAIMVVLFSLMAAVGVANTMLMATYERIREMGILRALGLNSSELRLLFLTEALLLGFLGSVVGLLLGVVLNAYFVTQGLDLSAYVQQVDVGYRLSGVVYSAWNPPAMVGSFLGGIVLAGVASWLPIRRAVRMTIVDCLRHT